MTDSVKFRMWAVFCIPLLLVAFVYSPIFGTQFMMDDYNFIVDWPLIQDLTHIPELIKGELPYGHAGGYRPLRNIYMAVLRQIFGLNAPLYHIHGVLIHIGITALTGLTFLKLLQLANLPTLPTISRKQKKNHVISEVPSVSDKVIQWYRMGLAVFGMIIVGLHPMMIEGVAFIQASFDTMGIGFAVGAYILFLYTIAQGKFRFGAIIGSVVLSCIAFLWYEMTYILPVLMVLTLFLFRKEPKTRSLIKQYGWILLLMAMVVGIFLLRIFILELPSRQISSPGGWFTFLIMTRSIFVYAVQMVFPLQSALVHEVAPAITTLVGDPEFYTKLSFWHPKTMIALTIIAGMAGTGYLLRYIRPLISLGIVWMIVGLLPVMNIVPTGTVFSERYMYISVIGFSMSLIGFLTWAIQNVKIHPTQITVISLICIGIVSVYGLCSFLRVVEWTDPIYFWKLEANRVPKIGKVRNELALEYRRAKRIDDAIQEFIMATKLQPYELSFHHNTSLALLEKGRYQEAALYAEQAMNLSLRDSVDSQKKQLQHLEFVYETLQDLQRSQSFYAGTMANTANPRIPFLHGNASLKLGETATAEASLRRAIAQDPTYEQAYTNLGALLNSQKRASESSILLEQARKAGVDSVNLLYNLAVAYRMIGDIDNAKRTIEQAHEKNPFDQSVERLYKELTPKSEFIDEQDSE